MSTPLRIVNFSIIHKDGWSSETDKYGIVAEPLNKTYNRGAFSFYLLLWGSDTKRFIEDIKIKDQILNMEVLGVTKKFGILRLEHKNSNTITNLVKRYKGVILSEIISNGIEKWTIAINTKSLKKFKEKLSQYGEILNYTEKSPNEVIPPPVLTERQVEALKIALNKGYFDYPKRIRGEDISKLLGMKTPTLIYHLRNAERSILEFYLDNFIND
ncbi:helix-turn-helix domain-containing protein [Sulfolobus sp. E11-6]|uniref:helix-turn-helix domain-containing protein n=1 Tax=Sulfolobus sp. E11-6 TaxID=2663020 RepID=UPI0013875446|nr:helix-turn-helix domain-containing protein [Sulfolobus sp. E11-6]